MKAQAKKTSHKRRGRPATGRGNTIGVKINDGQLAALDAWRNRQPDKPTRPEAICRLVEMMLGAGGDIEQFKQAKAAMNSPADDVAGIGGELLSLTGFTVGTAADEMVVAKLNLIAQPQTKKGKIFRILMSRATGSKLAGQLELFTKISQITPPDNVR